MFWCIPTQWIKNKLFKLNYSCNDHNAFECKSRGNLPAVKNWEYSEFDKLIRAPLQHSVLCQYTPLTNSENYPNFVFFFFNLRSIMERDLQSELASFYETIIYHEWIRLEIDTKYSKLQLFWKWLDKRRQEGNVLIDNSFPNFRDVLPSFLFFFFYKALTLGLGKVTLKMHRFRKIRLHFSA